LFLVRSVERVPGRTNGHSKDVSRVPGEPVGDWVLMEPVGDWVLMEPVRDGVRMEAVGEEVLLMESVEKDADGAWVWGALRQMPLEDGRRHILIYGPSLFLHVLRTGNEVLEILRKSRRDEEGIGEYSPGGLSHLLKLLLLQRPPHLFQLKEKPFKYRKNGLQNKVKGTQLQKTDIPQWAEKAPACEWPPSPAILGLRSADGRPSPDGSRSPRDCPCKGSGSVGEPPSEPGDGRERHQGVRSSR
jgi:hypothetical protein